MDFLEGGDLYARVEPNGPGLSKSQARTWIHHLTQAVQGVHSAGYVHADIKPENCLLDKDNNLYLADFGLAVLDGHTHLGAVPGTEAYMAPEMLGRGGNGVKMYKAVDVFALGITWYAMLFADLPWDAASSRDKDFQAFKLTGRLPGPSKSIGLLSHKLHHLLVRMMSPQPSKRATVDEVLAFLDSKEPWFIVRRKVTATTAPVMVTKPVVKMMMNPIVSPANTKARRSSLIPA
jgi:serine/threonine protein kinase